MSETLRKLNVVPLCHSVEDMTGLKEEDFYAAGVAVPRRSDRPAETNIQAIAEWLDSFNPDFRGVRVYYDGLPDTSEARISRMLARSDRPLDEIVKTLRFNGARIMGTEDPRIVAQLEHLVGQVSLLISVGNASDAQSKEDELGKLLIGTMDKRDQYIARRVGNTLKKGEEGILFQGISHNVRRFLDPSIRVSVPAIVTRALPLDLQLSSGFQATYRDCIR